MSGVCVFGSVNVDYVTRVSRIVRPGETVLGDGFVRHFGGKGANQAVAAARIGAQVTMIGAVGADDDGAAARENLRAEGVETGQLRVLEDQGTGRALISLAADGENAITVIPGANAHVTACDMPERCAILLAQMELSPEITLDAMQRAVARGMSPVLNFAPVPADIASELARTLISLAEVLVVNETELRQLTRCLGAEGALSDLARMWNVTLVVTLGAKGVRFSTKGDAEQSRPARKVTVVDTTGAGDTFVGVLAAGLATGHGLIEAVERASDAASLSCTKIGAQSGMPYGASRSAGRA